MEPNRTALTLFDFKLLERKSHLAEFKELAIPDLEKKSVSVFQEIDQAYNDSRDLRKPSKSREYSVLLSKAENLLDDLENIQTILKEKNEKTEETQVQLAKQHVEEMYKNLPPGERGLLKIDLQLFSNYSKRPEGKTYESPLGSYYNPTVSMKEMSTWFIPYVCRGDYLCTGFKFRTHHLGGEIYFNGMVTILFIEKKPEQRQLAMTHADPVAFPAPFATTVKESLSKAVQFLKSLGEKEIPLLEDDRSKELVKKDSMNPVKELIKVHKQGEESYVYVELPKKPKKLNVYEKAQIEVLEDLRKDLPKMLDTWNFEKFEILSTEKLLERGYDIEAACACDNIIFYNKKVENQNQPEINNQKIEIQSNEKQKEENGDAIKIAKPLVLHNGAKIDEKNQNLPENKQTDLKKKVSKPQRKLENKAKESNFFKKVLTVVKKPFIFIKKICLNILAWLFPNRYNQKK